MKWVIKELFVYSIMHKINLCCTDHVHTLMTLGTVIIVHSSQNCYHQNSKYPFYASHSEKAVKNIFLTKSIFYYDETKFMTLNNTFFSHFHDYGLV